MRLDGQLDYLILNSLYCQNLKGVDKDQQCREGRCIKIEL